MVHVDRHFRLSIPEWERILGAAFTAVAMGYSVLAGMSAVEGVVASHSASAYQQVGDPRQVAAELAVNAQSEEVVNLSTGALVYGVLGRIARGRRKEII
jgi:hypothetical protein